MFTTPGGRPASVKARASSATLAGVSSGPLMMMEQPAASAAAIFLTAWLIGKFHGVNAATTPTGSRSDIWYTFGWRAGITRP